MLRNVLVVEEDPLIALDLRQTVEHHLPGSNIHVATTPDEAVRRIKALGSLDLAFLDAPIEALHAAGLLELIARRGGRSFLLSGDRSAMSVDSELPVIAMPFSSDTIKSMLESAIDPR